ncbi:hypothetical protein ACRQ5D_18155 [Mucilaginibacter sp. P25]|uniref:Uncharacterized protein n=1 Tax=Mucilaginibacter gossypii TaxID=551996 RepID=A0A1G7RVT5_9SPHI|nr:hypothetical protein [Mucilaginibacter gossypii]SDG14937.1 hypothetical protein SAMN05192573_102378 [Mucilaginibacter gossypii]
MKNHDKATLPKIQIKQVQILNRVLNNNVAKYANQACFMQTTTETGTITATATGII